MIVLLIILAVILTSIITTLLTMYFFCKAKEDIECHHWLL